MTTIKDPTPERWEDQPRADYNLDSMRAEFRERLYGADALQEDIATIHKTLISNMPREDVELLAIAGMVHVISTDQAIEEMTGNLRCPECGKTIDNHVVVSRCQTSGCQEHFTGPSPKIFAEHHLKKNMLMLAEYLKTKTPVDFYAEFIAALEQRYSET